MMHENQGFIFDMDGVIVESNPAHIQAIRKFCKKYHQDFSEDFLVHTLFGRTNEEWIPVIFGDMSPQKLQKLADEKEQMFRRNFTPENHIVPGILGFIEQLHHQNYPMAMATSAPIENVDYILSRLSIKKYFTAVLDSSHVKNGKPDPEIYLKASKAVGQPPENCFVFEDSISGVRAALSAGTTVIGVATTHSQKELSRCHLVIDDFGNVEVEEILKVKPT